ncbi:MAG TPA: DUF6114 domain-containing protein [Streptosporangiaceae bacterium]
MSSSGGPAPAAGGGPVVRAWRAWRRWRRSRPFWAGVLLIAAGAELLLLPLPLNSLGLIIHVGIGGIAGILIGAVLIVCGLLLWFHPAQRTFYSIVAVVLSIGALIASNLGGFFVGTLLGVIGGSLAFAWMPDMPPRQWPRWLRRSASPAGPSAGLGLILADRDDAAGEHGGQDPAGPDATEPAADPAGPAREQSPAGEGAGQDGTGQDGAAPADTASPRDPAVPAPQPAPASGGRWETWPADDGAARADGGPPGRTAGRGRGRGRRDPGGHHPGGTLMAVGAVPVSLMLVASALNQAGQAHLTGQPAGIRLAAAVCTTPAPARPAGKNAPAQGTATPSPAPDPSGTSGLLPLPVPLPILGPLASPAASPAPSPTGTATPDPSPTPDPTTPCPSPSGTPAPSPSPSASVTGTPGPSPSPAGGKAAKKAARASAPAIVVPDMDATLTAGTATLTGLSFDGVANVDTANGTVPMLKFSMDELDLTGNPVLAVTVNGRQLVARTTSLDFTGNVTLLATKMTGDLLGVRLTFTPQNPPPVVLPTMQFTNVVTSQPFTTADSVQEANLDVESSAG